MTHQLIVYKNNPSNHIIKLFGFLRTVFSLQKNYKSDEMKPR